VCFLCFTTTTRARDACLEPFEYFFIFYFLTLPRDALQTHLVYFLFFFSFYYLETCRRHVSSIFYLLYHHKGSRHVSRALFYLLYYTRDASRVFSYIDHFTVLPPGSRDPGIILFYSFYCTRARDPFSSPVFIYLLVTCSGSETRLGPHYLVNLLNKINDK
jgi:hypothetical protein